MTSLRRRWSIYLLILALAFGARVAAAAWWQSRIPADQRFAFGDSHSYWALAERVVHGEPYQFGPQGRIFRTPGYPAALAVLFWGNGGEATSIVAARCWGALWGVAAVAATMGLARLLVSESVALVAGLIAAVQPEAIASSVFVLSEATFALPMLLQLTAWAAAWRASEQNRPTTVVVGWSLLSGLAAGIATLMRPGWLLFVPWGAVALLVLLVFRGRPSAERRRHLAIAATMLLALTLAMSPWWWRNYQVTGHFVATTTQVGASLYDGLNPDARGGSDMRFVPTFFALQEQVDATQETPPEGLFEERLDRRLRDASVTWARDNPGRVAQLALIKLGRLWNVWPNAQDLGSWTTQMLLAASYLPLIGLAVVGTWLSWREHPHVVLCLLPAGYLTSLHVVFVSSLRYRQPAIFTFSILAAVAICGLWERRWR